MMLFYTNKGATATAPKKSRESRGQGEKSGQPQQDDTNYSYIVPTKVPLLDRNPSTRRKRRETRGRRPSSSNRETNKTINDQQSPKNQHGGNAFTDGVLLPV
jgi:hypothetical protein